MHKPHPDPWGQLPIGRRTYMNLIGAGGDRKLDYWEIVDEAVEDWMRKQAEDHCGEPEFAGYQWKSLFLPHGTVLRTVFKGKNHHCRVECDTILYQGQAYSPTGFVNAVGGVRRNAWKCVWLLFPDAKHWQLADSLRAPRRPVGARRATRASRPIKVAPAAPGQAIAPLVPDVTVPPPQTRPVLLAPAAEAAPPPARPVPPPPAVEAAPPLAHPVPPPPAVGVARPPAHPVPPASAAGVAPPSARTVFAVPLSSQYRWAIRTASP